MAEEHKKLVNHRGQIKAKATRFKLYLESVETTKDTSQLKARLSKFNECWSDFESVQSEIELANDSDDTQNQEREQFENLYFELISKAEAFLTQTTSGEMLTATSSHSEINSSQNVKLPTIKIPTFTGRYEDWLPFHELFNSLIHESNSLSDIQKFHYLKTSLTGQASNVIESLEVSSTNYIKALELLKKRFENKRLIVNKHISSICEMDKIERESGSALRNMLDSTNKHLRALQSLGEPVDNWDSLLVYTLTKKLDFNSFRQWENHLTTTDVPTFADFERFLENRCQTLEAIETNKNKGKPQHKSSVPPTSKNAYSVITPHTYNNCPLCKNSHRIFQCSEFRSMQINDRLQTVKKLGLCINCFSKQHQIRDCKASNCQKCYKKHNTLLHIEAPAVTKKGDTDSSHTNPKTTLASENKKPQILLSTAIVKVSDPSGKPHNCRVLLDSGSQSNFISERMVQKLGFKKLQSSAQLVTGIGKSNSSITHTINCTISSCYNSYQATIECLVIKEITNELPTLQIDTSKWNIPKTLNLADPNFSVPGPIDMLIGAELFFNLMSIGQIRPHKDGPIFQKTSLGWIASGKLVTGLENNMCSVTHLSVEEPVQQQLRRFWEIEECEPQKNQVTTEEERCEAQYAKTTTRDPLGRYTVDLPLKDNINELGESKSIAMSRFLQIERKLSKNPPLHKDYSDFMEEYKTLGHMKIVDDITSEPSTAAYYIPHLPVIRQDSSTTKLRVVFDASAKTTTGISLNDTLMVGPSIQQDVFSILARFRSHKFVLTGDIEKMYRQIRINEQQADLQRILWRKDSTEPIKIYKLVTVTYGTASAPFLAIRTLQQVAIDEQHKYPVGSTVVLRDFYVDDLMTGAHTEEEAKTIQTQISELLELGGFHIRKWNSNSPNILKDIDPSLRAQSNDMNKAPTKVLGMLWNAEQDHFQYTVKEQQPYTKITKRSVLSEIASIFDPLGLLGPVILKPKLLMQDLWKLNVTWDESLPSELHSLWQIFRQQLVYLKDINIPRYTFSGEAEKRELHGFCDASERAYGACIYVRTIDFNGKVSVRLLCSKSRVAPLKKQTIPRLELCGALLLSELTNKVIKSEIHFDSYTLWSDSTIVLAWIKASPSNWKTFVSNRVNEIQRLTVEKCNWKHVRTNSNPADLISRGLNPVQIITCSLWWCGPTWLAKLQKDWPEHSQVETTDVPEQRKTQLSLHSLQITTIIDSTRCSTFQKLQRVAAYCLRFINNMRHPNSKQSGPLTATELQSATTYLVKSDQQYHLHDDYKRLERGKHVKPSSKLHALHPFIDQNGIIRVGGRLEHADIHNDQKHPIILAPKSHLTYLIAQREHITKLHAGPQLLLSSLRQRYWPIRGRDLTRKVVHSCVKCFKASPKELQPQMGNLPSSRLEMVRPFTNTGTDICGPVYIRSSRRRKSPTVKGYIVLFVCMTTRAIHLELATDLTTETFLAAFKRFISRRGICANVYSDNGTNYVGANRELKELRDIFSTQEHQRKIIDETAPHQITWHFIPPRSPHFGGLWEAGVRSMKYHMRRVVGNTALTYEELYTVLTVIEACLNSRPITPISTDPNDPLPLTPGHFLTGTALTALPEPCLIDIKVNRLSLWQRTCQITQHFWVRWSKEYLSFLQQRSKWRSKTVNLKPGQLVVVKEDNLPPMKWVTARVLEVHPGADGTARVATIKTSMGKIKRAVNRLCPLPLDTSSVQ